jgi:hypothetical protein
VEYCRRIRDFSPAELLMLGEGGGSVWEMTWEKGSVGTIVLIDQ